jgi:alpha-galactosidase
VPSPVTADWRSVGLKSKQARVRDLWTHRDSSAVSDRYTATVPSHGVVMLRVWPGN